MGSAPENTLASFARAIELGVDAIELDVQLSRDGEVVVMHDQTVDRTTNGHGHVRDLSTLELKTLDAGSHAGPQFAGERIPTLAEVLNLERAMGAPVIIEIKNDPLPYAGIEERIIQVVSEAGALERVQIISFDHGSVRRVREVHADVATGLLYACRLLDPVTLARQAGASALSPHWAYVRALDVRLAHEAGLSVHPWVTSDRNTMRGLIAMDVDSVATNDPDLALEALGRSQMSGEP
jgi:glycerophosphoryl diester phosphodiesterase